ncbi:hypothetical protein [Antarctobacter jejuensis]|uniref:hypothetical protein n=1 Tax=Antarctobacter jejuensis TaxID=1439938 RepID=UPI003FD51EA5
MAYAVREAGLRTVIPDGAVCHSACSYLFLAGVDRSAQGELGVHQLASNSDSLRAGQVALADIMSAFDDFGVNGAVVNKMLLTPANSMYVFDSGEMTDLGLNRATPCAGAEPHLARIGATDAGALRLHLRAYADCATVQRADSQLAALTANAAKDKNPTPVTPVAQEAARPCTEAEGWDQILRVCRAALAAGGWDTTQEAALQNAIGAGFLETGDAFAADEAFQEALTQMPDTPAFVENRALALIALDQHEAAADLLRAAIAATSAPPERLIVRLGMADRGAGKVNTAFQVWDDLLSDDAADAARIRLWQEALARQGHFQQAIDGRYTALTRIAVQQCSYDAECLPPGADAPPRLLPVPVADVPLDLSRGAAATSLLMTLGEPDGEGPCNQGQPEMNIHLCLAMLQEGDFDSAERSEIENLLARQYLDIGDFDEADAAMTRAIALVPPDSSLFVNRAVVRYRKGDFAGALVDFEAVSALRKNWGSNFIRVQSEISRGNTLARLGRAEEAAEVWYIAFADENADENSQIRAAIASDLQRFLKSAGHYTGGFDGKFGPESRQALTDCATAGDCVLSGSFDYYSFSEIPGFSYRTHPPPPKGPLYFDKARRDSAKAALDECSGTWDHDLELVACTRAISTGWLLNHEAAKAYEKRSNGYYYLDNPRQALEDYRAYLRFSGYSLSDAGRWYVLLLLMADEHEEALFYIPRLQKNNDPFAEFYLGLSLAGLGRMAEAEQVWLADYDRLSDVDLYNLAFDQDVYMLYVEHLRSKDLIPVNFDWFKDGKTPALRGAIGRCASDPACYTLK